MLRRPALLAIFALLCTPGISAQSSEPGDAVDRALLAWQAEYGENWRARIWPETGAAALLWGGGAEAGIVPRTEGEYEELARTHFDRAYALFRLDDRSLRFEQLSFLPLSQIGSTDKHAVVFRQEVAGVPVVRGFATALFGPDGVLLALDTTGLPDLGGFSVRPRIGPYVSIGTAADEFLRLEGREALDVGEPELVIYPHRIGSLLEPRLAWAIEMHVPTEETGGMPLGRRIYVSADRRRAVALGDESLVHAQDLTGDVQVWATPGLDPILPSNPETLHLGRGIGVSSSVGSTVTDENGRFVIPNAGPNPVDVEFRFESPLVDVEDQGGPNHVLTQNITPGVNASVTMNPTRTEFLTAQANAWDGVYDFNEFIHTYVPGDTTMDFPVRCNVNINSSCNAFFNGGSINFYRKRGSCNNTCYSTVVAHEEGHWANVRYGSGNGADGFGEGAADTWAMYIYDTPIIAASFFTNGGFLRTGNNSRQFCGDNNRGCYGQVHTDGQVLMGAMWKVRERLNATHGGASGDAIANTLMLTWFNAFNDGQIHSIIEEHWLVLDDDDSNIFNGTPNFADIDGGFRQQGFPGIDLDVISVEHDELPNTLDELGPYVVNIQAEPVVGSVVTSATLHYEVGGATTISLPMTSLGGGAFTASIPGLGGPASVQYWVETEDDLNNTDCAPRTDGDRWDFAVGTEVRFHREIFNPGNGYTHGALSGSSDWQNGEPGGGSGSAAGGWEDPEYAYAGRHCWGTDIGGGGTYNANAHTFLESPAINATGRVGVHLRFRRWLTVERNDTARILVNNVEVWSSPNNADLIDSAWTEFDLDISAQADNSPNLVLRFELISNGSVHLGGWNIDDLELVSILKPGTLVLTGPETTFPGATATFRVTGVPLNAKLYLLSSDSNAGTVIKNHPFDIGRPFIVEGGPVSPNPDNSYEFILAIDINAPPAVRFFEAAAGGGGGPILDSNLWVMTIQ